MFDNLKIAITEIGQNAENKGFHNILKELDKMSYPMSFPVAMALVMSELGEAVEAHRK